jgi:putative membrane protein
MSNRLTSRRTIAIAIVVAAGACSRFRGHSSGAPAPAPARPAPASNNSVRRAAAKNAPSDANIAAILLAANNTDISYARLAPSRAQSDAVKDFAKAMLNDHTAVNDNVMETLNAIKLNPEDNTTSLDFRDESATKRDMMRELSGHAFDVTYMDNEVSYHTKLLASIDTLLAPSARNPQLQHTIAAIRPAVAAHLAHAQQVRTRIASGH